MHSRYVTESFIEQLDISSLTTKFKLPTTMLTFGNIPLGYDYYLLNILGNTS